jgi:hypothetical protein
MSVISAFCNIQELSLGNNSWFLQKTSIFVEFLKTSKDEVLLEDTLNCLFVISTSSDGRKFIFEAKCIQSLAYLITTYSSDKIMMLAVQLLHHILSFKEPFIRAEIILPDITNILPLLSKVFRSNRTLLQFQILDTLILLLSFIGPFIASITSQQWVEDIRQGLFTILSSKISEKQRNPAISLSSIMLEYLGEQWAMGEEGTPGSGGKFIELLIHFITIEIKVALEDPQPSKYLDTLSTSYWILEKFVIFLSHGEEDSNNLRLWKNLSADALYRTNQNFLAAFGCILEYLGACRDENKSTDPLALASVRVLGAWLAEETEGLKKETIAVLPFLLEVKDTSPAPTDPLVFLLPGLLHLTADEEARSTIIQSNGHLRIIEFFVSNYQQLLHAFLEDKPVKFNSALLSTSLGIFLNLLCLEISPDLTPFVQLLLPLSSVVFGIGKSTLVGDRIFVMANATLVTLSIIRHVGEETLVKILNGVDNLHKVNEGIVLFFLHTKTSIPEDTLELWYLAINALVQSMTTIPTLHKAVVSSGIATSLINSLSTSSLPVEDINKLSSALKDLVT